VTVSGLSPAEYQLDVVGVSINCNLEGGNSRRVTLPWTAEASVTVNFNITCAPVTRLAFADTADGNAEIYTVNSNGTGVTRLTVHPASDVEPAWSPDGTKIAFRSNRDGADEIYVMNADGSNPERLTHAAGGNVRPAWSPDGTKLAFTSYRDGNGEIYVMNADGSGPVNITNDLADDGDPAWSPDGARIAFRSARNRHEGYTGIYLTDAAGSTVVSLTQDVWVIDGQPAWSPDGTWLAISRLSETSGIYLMNPVDGSIAWSTLAPDPLCALHVDPVWSPDSRNLAFSETNWCSSGPESAVRVVRLDTGWLETNGLPIASGFNPSWRR
jgi:Tol biopolymer transport system component